MYLEFQVLLKEKVEKSLENLPLPIVNKFRGWIKFVELYGVSEARLIKGFHDEPLKGNRKGQRSIRLNRAYRAIYIQHSTGHLEIIEVIEVHKHDY